MGASAQHSVLLVAFHFPPAAIGSGHLRTLGFARYLPAAGWDPIVLTARPIAYPRTSPIVDGVIPEGCRIVRTFALDARRHFGVAGRYPAWLARPDRWQSWWPSAVWHGLQLIRRHQVRAIWSTYPIMTAHCIASTLHRITGLPWVADFRDPVSVSATGAAHSTAQDLLRWERKVMQRATAVTFTAPGAMQESATRYPAAAPRMNVIENGYDERAFIDLPSSRPLAGRPLTLVHSGLLYPDGRNPAPFLAALARLRHCGTASAQTLRVVLRASGTEPDYQAEVDRLGLQDMVTLGAAVSNRDALVEQARADGLLLFQGARFNAQIPAKLYEYLRVGRPVFALVDPTGNTAAVLRDIGVATLAPFDDVGAITASLADFLESVRSGTAPLADPQVVARHSRAVGAAKLAEVLDRLTAEAPPGGEPAPSARRRNAHPSNARAP